MGIFRRMAGFLLVLGFVLPSGAQASVAGVFQFGAGEVQVLSASGASKAARKGTPLSVGDTVVSGRAATAQVKMGDGAIVVVQPLSRVSVLEFHYEGREDGTERVRYRLEQGGMRAVTGAIGRSNRQNYLIETPVAHIGVRGTDHESYYFAPAAAGGGETAKPGAYNKVNLGLTHLRNDAGEVVVGPNQVGYVASTQENPSLLPSIPEFFNRGAAPRAGQGRAEERRATAAGTGQLPEAEVVQPVRTAIGSSLTPGGPGGGAGGAVTAGSVVGFVEPVGGASFGRSGAGLTIASNGAVLGNSGSDAAFGVNWGSWLGGVATVGGTATSGATHFMSSSQATSASQLAALPPSVVTATYSYAGGPEPANHLGVAGTINSLSVGANFGTQQITGYALNATVGATAWTASGSGSFAQFSGGSGISISGNCTGCAGGPSSPAANGTAHGVFVGPAAERLMTSFGLKSASQALSGAALLSR